MVEHYQIGGRTSRGIAESAERAIRDGSLAPGSRLPTVRALAGQLDVSPATVAAAYRFLGDRGLVVAGGRAGTAVAPRPPLPFASVATSVPEDARDLRMGFPDRRLLPPLGRTLAQLEDDRPLPNRFGARHDERLVEIAAERFTRDGVPADRLTVLGGALDAIERAAQARLAAGDRVAVEDPGYPPVGDLLRAQGLRPVPFGLDDEGPLPDELGRALRGGARAVIFTPRAQNPTGAAVTGSRARELRQVLAGSDVLVVEDDHAGPVAGAEYVPVGPEVSDSWVVVRSVSKSLSPDLRLAVVAGDPMTIDRVEGRQSVGPGWVSTILQRAVAALWDDAQTRTLLERAEQSYARRRAALVDALARRGLAATGRSGLNVWVPVQRESAAVEAVLKAGWATAPGERFRFAAGPAVRITVSNLDLDDVEPLADAFAEAVGLREPGY